MTIPGLFQAAPLTIGTIFERMRTVFADGEVVSPETRTTYGEISERILRLATALRDEFGIQPGDRVATFASNSARHFELYYAVPLIGAVLHTVNIRLHAEQIAYIVQHAEDRVVFLDGDLTETFAAVADQVTCVEAYVRMGDGPDAGLSPLHDHDELIARHAPATALPDVPEEAASGLCYTSGTTGMPKGVLYSHRGVVLHSYACCMADGLGLSESDRILPVVPMFHAFAWSLPYAAPFTGAELVFHGPDNSSANLARWLRDERVTVTAGVPTIWKELLPSLRSGDLELPDLRLVGVGGSASPRALIEAYDDLGVGYLQIWGMTETGPIACTSRLRRRHRGLDRSQALDQLEKTGTILAGLEARVTDSEGNVLPWDGASVGELEVRGPWVASDYYRDDTSAEKFHDGWLRTGDVAYLEPDGYFRIVDRAKDLVKSGGEWISSVELEGHLLAHPDVADAAVVGAKSAKWDERPVAVLVAVAGATPDLASVQAFLSERVPRWWFPDEVVLVDEIPKTSVGKLDKKVLRAQLAHLELA